MRKHAYSNPDYRRLVRLARPFYSYTGANDWSHIQEVRRRAAKMAHKLYGRGLTPEEYAAVLFHDSTKHELGGENHGRMGADRALQVLAAASVLSDKQRQKAAEAIAVHDDNLKKFPSRTAELLASADANPPDLDWLLNKSWVKNKAMGNNKKQALDNMSVFLGRKYGTGGKFNWPGIYKRYYGDAVKDYQTSIDNLTPEIIMNRLGSYWDKYDIDPENPRIIHNV